MKTFILYWNPSLSSYTTQRLTEDIQFDDLNNEFDWSVREYDKVKVGDRFFMVRCKNKPVPGKLNQYGRQLWEPVFDDTTGVCMSGYFTSEAFQAGDWSGKGRIVHYAKMYVEIAINPDRRPILKTADLLDTIPGFDWKNSGSGRVMDEESAAKLTTMWDAFCKEHKDDICNAGDYAFIDEKIYEKL